MAAPQLILRALAMIFGNFGNILKASLPLFAVMLADPLLTRVGFLPEGFARFGDLAQHFQLSAGLYFFVYFLALTWMSVAVHRIILIGETCPLLCGFALVPVFSYVFLSLIFAAITYGGNKGVSWLITQSGSIVPGWAALTISLVVVWFVQRFSVMLPAIAIERGIGPAAAWRATNKIALAIFIIVLLLFFLGLGQAALLQRLSDLPPTWIMGIKLALGWFMSLFSLGLISAYYERTVERLSFAGASGRTVS